MYLRIAVVTTAPGVWREKWAKSDPPPTKLTRSGVRDTIMLTPSPAPLPAPLLAPSRSRSRLAAAPPHHPAPRRLDHRLEIRDRRLPADPFADAIGARHQPRRIARPPRRL